MSKYKCADCDGEFSSRKELLDHDCIGEIYGEIDIERGEDV